MRYDFVRSDLLCLLIKEQKKRRYRLILNLGCPLDDSRYFRRLETAKNDGNPFQVTVVSGGRERKYDGLEKP